MVDRIPTYVPGLDKLVEGGIPVGAVVLVSGTPGTGKSILCSQIAYFNALKGKKCLYINLEQNKGRLENQMKQFGWDSDKVPTLKIVSIDTSKLRFMDDLLEEIKLSVSDIIVLDSLDTISTNPASLEDLNMANLEKIAEVTIPMMLDAPTVGRLKLKKIFSAVSESNATAFFTSERVEGSEGITRDTISEFLCDGIILLHAVEGEDGFRTLNIPKMRLTRQRQGIYSFSMTDKGIVVKAEEA